MDTADRELEMLSVDEPPAADQVDVLQAEVTRKPASDTDVFGLRHPLRPLNSGGSDEIDATADNPTESSVFYSGSLRGGATPGTLAVAAEARISMLPTILLSGVFSLTTCIIVLGVVLVLTG